MSEEISGHRRWNWKAMIGAGVALLALSIIAFQRGSGKPAAPSGGVSVRHGEAGMTLALSDEARAMASVETAPVEARRLEAEIRAFGKVQYNETGLATITARVEGYVERLFVDYAGAPVEKGDHLLEIYSPDLVVAQRELLLAIKNPESSLAESARLKLARWEIGPEEIDAIIKSGQPRERVTLRSPIRGTVYEKNIVERSAIRPGDVLYRIANLDSVWVNLDIYEYELSWIKIGQKVDIAAEALPGKSFVGLVTFVQPFLSEETRTVRARVNIGNTGQELKPGMFVSAVIRVPVVRGGLAGPTGREGKYSCPMHPEILQETGGACPICGMELKVLPGSPVSLADDEWKVLAVPASAVLDSGQRKIVYVERAKGEFAATELSVGQRAGSFYPALSGLKEGDRVAIRGNFLLDSQFQISGLPSLFYPEGQASMTSMQHHGGDAGASQPPPEPAPPAPAAGEHQGHGGGSPHAGHDR